MNVSKSANFLESIANHPRVIRAIGFSGERFAAGESWNWSIGLEWPSGGIVFVRESPGVYSGHLVFAPKTRDVLGKTRDAFRYMFTRTPAHTITGQIRLENLPARRIARALMNHTHDHEGFSHYALTAREWRTRKDS